MTWIFNSQPMPTDFGPKSAHNVNAINGAGGPAGCMKMPAVQGAPLRPGRNRVVGNAYDTYGEARSLVVTARLVYEVPGTSSCGN